MCVSHEVKMLQDNEKRFTFIERYDAPNGYDFDTSGVLSNISTFEILHQVNKKSYDGWEYSIIKSQVNPEAIKHIDQYKKLIVESLNRIGGVFKPDNIVFDISLKRNYIFALENSMQNYSDTYVAFSPKTLASDQLKESDESLFWPFVFYITSPDNIGYDRFRKHFNDLSIDSELERLFKNEEERPNLPENRHKGQIHRKINDFLKFSNLHPLKLDYDNMVHIKDHKTFKNLVNMIVNIPLRLENTDD